MQFQVTADKIGQASAPSQQGTYVAVKAPCFEAKRRVITHRPYPSPGMVKVEDAGAMIDVAV
jgi:hypothetical protein